MAQSPALREQIALARQEAERRLQPRPPTMREQIALARQEATRRMTQPSEPSWTERAIPLGMRIGGAIGGGILGGIAGGGVNPLGYLAGGAAGAGLGETAAQRYEQGTGQRESYNLPQIGMQTALGAIPMGRAFGSTGLRVMAGRGAQGGLMGGGATVATSLAETGELPSLREVGVGAGFGTVLGGGMGAVEAGAFRRASLASLAQKAPREVLALPPGPSYRVTPDGRVVPVGMDVPPMPVSTPDPSYARGVPAENARREIAGLLPEGRGTGFIAGPGGVAAADAEPSVLSALARLDRGPDPSGVRSVPAAVVARNIDPLLPPKEAVSVRQYSSDPSVVDAPLVSSEDMQQLRLMREDLDVFVPERGRLIRDPNDPNSSIYAHGGPGSFVADDIRVISGQRSSNAQVARAIDDLIAGKTPTNKLHVAALDAARGYTEKRLGYRGPQIAAEALESVKPQSTIDDFEEFAKIWDDIEPSRYGEPGESGFISPILAARLGGAVVGGAAGAATGDDPLDRLSRGALGALVGASAPSLLGMRGASRLSTQAVPPGVTSPVTSPVAPPVARRYGGRPAVSPSGQMGTPITRPMATFNPLLQKFTNPLVREGVEQVLRENAGFSGQGRGFIDTKTLGKFANMVEIDATKVLPKGTALNSDQITAYARAFQQTTRKVKELAARVNSAGATDTDILALQGARAEQEVIAASFVGGRTEAGRALAAFNFWNGVLDTGDVKLIRDVVNAPGARKETQRIARELGKLPDDLLVRYRYLQKQKQSSIMDKVRSYYYANILSGVKTHERNFIGNVANIASNLVVHPIGAGIDAATSAVTGAPRTMRLDEMPTQAAGALAGLERGIRDFAFTMKEGVSPDALSRSLHTGELGKLDIPRVEFAGGGLNPFNLPGRFLDASDTLFRSISKNMELYGLASTTAKNEGLTGQAFLDRVATLRSATTPEGIALRDQAHLFARRSVFQEQPGEFVQKIQELSRMFPPLTFIMPFIKTPANILRQGIEFSPLGAAMPAFRQGGRAGVQAQARVAVGTAAAGVLAYLAATGRLSGRGPSSTAERNALYEKGWEPNSVKIGDKWVSYQLFQPVSVQASIIANMYEQLAESKADEDTIATTVADTMSRSMNSFLNQSFLSGLFDFVEAIQSVDRSAARVAGRTASGFVPLVSLQRQIAQGMDPVIRQPRTVEQNILTSIPGLSQSVPPRLTRFGEEVTRPGGPLKRLFDPFNISPEVDDPVANELSRLGVNISVPSGRLTVPVQLQDRTGLEEFPMSDAQTTAFRQSQGRAVRQILERVMQSPGYRQLSDVDRERLIRSVRTRAVGAVRDQARRELLSGARTPDMAGTPRGVGKQFTSGPFAGQTWTVVDGTPQRVN